MTLSSIAKILGISLTGAYSYWWTKRTAEKTKHPSAEAEYRELKDKLRKGEAPGYFYNEGDPRCWNPWFSDQGRRK